MHMDHWYTSTVTNKVSPVKVSVSIPILSGINYTDLIYKSPMVN